MLATLTAGETVGEVELVLCRNSVADAIAVRPTATLFLPRDEFFALVQDHPAILHGLYGIAVRRHAETNLALGAGSSEVADESLLAKCPASWLRSSRGRTRRRRSSRPIRDRNGSRRWAGDAGHSPGSAHRRRERRPSRRRFLHRRRSREARSPAPMSPRVAKTRAALPQPPLPTPALARRARSPAIASLVERSRRMTAPRGPVRALERPTCDAAASHGGRRGRRNRGRRNRVRDGRGVFAKRRPPPSATAGTLAATIVTPASPPPPVSTETPVGCAEARSRGRRPARLRSSRRRRSSSNPPRSSSLAPGRPRARRPPRARRRPSYPRRRWPRRSPLVKPSTAKPSESGPQRRRVRRTRMKPKYIFGGALVAVALSGAAGAHAQPARYAPRRPTRSSSRPWTFEAPATTQRRAPSFWPASSLRPPSGSRSTSRTATERIGRNASAWREFREGEKLARARNDKRAAVAAQRAGGARADPRPAHGFGLGLAGQRRHGSESRRRQLVPGVLGERAGRRSRRPHRDGGDSRTTGEDLRRPRRREQSLGGRQRGRARCAFHPRACGRNGRAGRPADAAPASDRREAGRIAGIGLMLVGAAGVGVGTWLVTSKVQEIMPDGRSAARASGPTPFPEAIGRVLRGRCRAGLRGGPFLRESRPVHTEVSLSPAMLPGRRGRGVQRAFLTHIAACRLQVTFQIPDDVEH